MLRFFFVGAESASAPAVVVALDEFAGVQIFHVLHQSGLPGEGARAQKTLGLLFFAVFGGGSAPRIRLVVGRVSVVFVRLGVRGHWGRLLGFGGGSAAAGARLVQKYRREFHVQLVAVGRLRVYVQFQLATTN